VAGPDRSSSPELARGALRPRAAGRHAGGCAGTGGLPAELQSRLARACRSRFARCGVLHTWDSYRGALDGLLRTRSGSPRRPRLQAADVPITLAEGQRDLVPVPGRAAGFAAAAPTVRHLTHPDAAHLMPLSEGHWCATLIAVGRGGR
jgi:hypothetical protein